MVTVNFEKKDKIVFCEKNMFLPKEKNAFWKKKKEKERKKRKFHGINISAVKHDSIF